MLVYGWIPARSRSEGLPDKNILKINGHPLLAYGKKLKFDKIIVSTDSEKYLRIAKNMGYNTHINAGML